jgi:hypothetical protein
VGRARWGGGPLDPALLAFLADVRAVGVLGVDRLSSWPDRGVGIEPTQPQLVAARPGVLARFLRVPVTLVGRIDLGEAARPLLDTSIGPLSGAILDDAYVLWQPTPAAQVVAGRSRVPFAASRRREEIDEPTGAPAFLVDRVAPDRRWGVGLQGDLDELGWFAGAYADLDVLEQRVRLDDPSRGGGALLLAQVEWSPIAPLAAGAGTLVRLRREGGARVDASLSARVEWGALGLVAELLGARDDELALGGHVQVALRASRRVDLVTRAEWDPGAPGGGVWAATAAIGWNVTRDRRNRVAVVGWLRREVERENPLDGIVVYLQASL